MITYACPVAKPEYTPPELQGKRLSSIVRTPEQDAFGLGVLIFQLLMEGNHPFRAQWLGKGDPPPLEERIASGAFPYTATPGLPVRPPKYAPELDLAPSRPHRAHPALLYRWAPGPAPASRSIRLGKSNCRSREEPGPVP